MLVGTAGPGATLTLKAGTSLIATTTADIRGAWKTTSSVFKTDTATTILATSSQGGSAQKVITIKP